MMSRYAIPFLLVLLLATSGCLGIISDRPEITIRDIDSRENLTLVNTYTGWETENGTDVSDDCVLELRKRLVGDEVDEICSEISSDNNTGEIDDSYDIPAPDMERIERNRIQKENLTKELEEARRNNETERTEYLRGAIKNLELEIEDLQTRPAVDCFSPDEKYLVSIPSPDTERGNVLVRGVDNFVPVGGDCEFYWFTYFHNFSSDSEEAMQLLQTDRDLDSDTGTDSDRVEWIVEYLMSKSESSS